MRGGINKHEKKLKAHAQSRHRHRLHLGYQALQRCFALLSVRVLQVIKATYDFIDNHDRLSMLASTLLIALPVPIIWWIFAAALSIQEPSIRAIACWLYVIIIFAVAGSRFDRVASIKH